MNSQDVSSQIQMISQQVREASQAMGNVMPMLSGPMYSIATTLENIGRTVQSVNTVKVLAGDTDVCRAINAYRQIDGKPRLDFSAPKYERTEADRNGDHDDILVFLRELHAWMMEGNELNVAHCGVHGLTYNAEQHQFEFERKVSFGAFTEKLTISFVDQWKRASYSLKPEYDDHPEISLAVPMAFVVTHILWPVIKHTVGKLSTPIPFDAIVEMVKTEHLYLIYKLHGETPALRYGEGELDVLNIVFKPSYMHLPQLEDCEVTFSTHGEVGLLKMFSNETGGRFKALIWNEISLYMQRKIVEWLPVAVEQLQAKYPLEQLQELLAKQENGIYDD